VNSSFLPKWSTSDWPQFRFNSQERPCRVLISTTLVTSQVQRSEVLLAYHPFFSWSGQLRTDRNVDTMARKDLEAPLDLWFVLIGSFDIRGFWRHANVILMK
jgi:hypothetical protein